MQTIIVLTDCDGTMDPQSFYVDCELTEEGNDVKIHEIRDEADMLILPGEALWECIETGQNDFLLDHLGFYL